MLLFKKIRVNLGLDRCRLVGSAAAPIMRETLEYFACLNIRIDECYGMSESTGKISISSLQGLIKVISS